jgi:hypothetical protein
VEPKRKKEKVVYIADDGGAVKTLQEMIDDIRKGKLRNFIVTAQKKDQGEFQIRYYFYGEDPCTTCQGLVVRMLHYINQYMDGVDIFGDGE